MLRVLVAEDSPTARRQLVALLSADPDIEVVGEARDGVEAIDLCRKLRPDLVTMDLAMPNIDGVEATRQIMVEGATPVVMVSSLDPSDVRRSMLALNAGALAVLAKPSGPGTPRFERDSRDLIATIKAMAQVKLVRRWPAVPPYRSTATPVPQAPREVAAIGVVASTGGPNALRQLISGLPPALRQPVLIVQHIASGFALGFAEWLASTTQRDVKLARDGEQFTAGAVYVAPDDRHLSVSQTGTVVSAEAPIDGFRPSGNRLLHSLAEVFGARAIGVILTGMGQDGVTGLRALRDAGSPVFAQDEESCDIFGMPGTALSSGVVTATTRLADIPTRIAELVSKENARR